MRKILVQYQEEHFPREVRLKIIDVPESVIQAGQRSTMWRALQQHFDPGYHYDNLKFWDMGQQHIN